LSRGSLRGEQEAAFRYRLKQASNDYGKTQGNARRLNLKAPEAKSVADLAREAKHCKNCDLYKNATQTVFGEGRESAKVMMVGEQPGDQEDQQGRPFVGPAGRLLDKALEEAGINRQEVYITNVVKHFKWEPRGKRRIHKKPSAVEIEACRLWLNGEIAAIRPVVIVCLGATAAQVLLGNDFRVTKQLSLICSYSRSCFGVAPFSPLPLGIFSS
jgi:uracil-DNA glycosylase